MDYTSIGLGLLVLTFGIITAILRIKNPSKFAKLQAMKRAWGETAGTLIHFIGYTVIPIGVGIAFISLGMKGISIF